MNKVLVVGLGDVGQHVLELLARTPQIAQLTGASNLPDEGKRAVYRARSGAAHQGYYPEIRFVELDLNDVPATASLLEQIEPHVIVNTASLQSWWVIERDLPKEIFQKLDAAGYGPWLPFHLTLTYKLMTAIRQAGINTRVVSAPFPDAVNAVLGKVNLAPTIGMGNLDLMAPGIQKVVAEKLSVPMRSVQIFLVAAHFVNDSLSTYGTTGGAPYFLKILVDGEDSTDRFDHDKLLRDAHTDYPKGRDDHFITASSGVKNVLAILSNARILTHAPGPAGLPGGYPVRLGAEEPELVLPKEITKDEAMRINEQDLRYDGIEKIEADGTIVFTQKSAEIMMKLLNYDSRKMKLAECEQRARELRICYHNFLKQYSVKRI
jgi:hypothetical protein